MSRTGVIGSVGKSAGSVNGCMWKRHRTWRQRARPSAAQQVRAKIFKNGCAIDRAAMSHFSCRMNKPQRRFCSVACRLALRRAFWIARRALSVSGVSSLAALRTSDKASVSSSGHFVKHVFAYRILVVPRA